MRTQTTRNTSESIDSLTLSLVPLFADALGIELDKISPSTDFFESGGDEESCSLLVDKLRELITKFIYPVAIYDAPTPVSLARYLTKFYSNSTANFLSGSGTTEISGGDFVDGSVVKENQIMDVINLLPRVGKRRRRAIQKN